MTSMDSTQQNRGVFVYPRQTQPIDQSKIMNQPIVEQPGFRNQYLRQIVSGASDVSDGSTSTSSDEGSPFKKRPATTGAQVGNIPPPPPGCSKNEAMQDKWMGVPAGIRKCPPGLEYLTALDLLVVKQKIELFEVKSGVETNNEYMIRNNMGQRVYYAKEDNDWCTLNCCEGRIRPFDIKIFDAHKNEVIHLYRPLACIECCFPCCLQRIEVSSPPGNRLGTIEQEWNLCSPAFSVKNNLGEIVLRIEGPSSCTFYVRAKFKVLTPSGQQIGHIAKQFAGFAREIYTDADVFSVTFPLDLEVRVKALLLGACLLIDFMYFEN